MNSFELIAANVAVDIMLHACLMGYRRGLARRILKLIVSVVFLLIGATDLLLFSSLYDTAAEEADDCTIMN